MSDAERARHLLDITGNVCDYNTILQLIKNHPQGGDDNELANVIFEGNYNQHFALSDDEFSEDSISMEPAPNHSLEDEIITDNVISFIGELYNRELVLEIVRTHPHKENLLEVINTVLDTINIDTVDGEWLRKASNGLIPEEEEEAEEIEEFKLEGKKEEENSIVRRSNVKNTINLLKSPYYVFEEQVSESQRYHRNAASDILSTELHREFAFEVIEHLHENRLKYSLDTILCVLRHVERPQNTLRVAQQMKGLNIEEWFAKDEKLKKELPEVECSVCWGDFSPLDMYNMSCESKHEFCYDCLQGAIQVSLGEGEIPMCPSQDCNHLVTEREVIHIFGDGEVLHKFSRMLLKVGLASLENLVGCPTPACENWLVLPDIETKVKCPCEICNKDFCSLCKELYHYQISCDDMKEMTVKWIRWTENREENIGKVKELANLQDRLKDLEKDEQWKRSHLRCCPKCHRPIEKLEGCDLMKCGKDYHGGNNQKGCGARFRWTKAVAYNPPADQVQSLLQKKLVMHRDKENVLSFGGADGIYGVCDLCHTEIEGVGFLCVNCPCYTVCEKCEPEMNHDPNHIMQVLGIEFEFAGEESGSKTKSKSFIMRRIRKAVSRKKNQLIRLVEQDETDEV